MKPNWGHDNYANWRVHMTHGVISNCITLSKQLLQLIMKTDSRLNASRTLILIAFLKVPVQIGDPIIHIIFSSPHERQSLK